MQRLALVLALLFSAIPAFAQTTTVSGTITDAGGQAWAFGTVQFTFRPSNSNPVGPYFQNGTPFNINTTVPSVPLPLDGTGSFSGLAVPDNKTITPSGSTFTVQVCPAATTPCFSQNLTITGTTQAISASIIPPAINLNLSVPLLGARAYTDVEVSGALPGTQYFNLTDNRLHVCLQTGFPPCTWFVLNGGGGTVTNFSAGNLSPLFTTSIATSTTTPALSFALQNAAAGTVYGNPSGSPAPPSFNAPSSFSGIVTSVTASSPITSSGGTTPNVACPTCVISVSGTANQITSSGGTAPTLSIPATFIAPGTITATTSITDSGLTANRCVQTGAAGILTSTTGACGTSTAILAAPITCNLGAPINSISSGVTTTIIACATTAPSSGCPCRAYVSWSLSALGTSSTEQVEGAMSDGTTQFAGTSAILNNQVTTGNPGINRSDFSSNTYANGASVTFTLSAVSDHTWSVETLTNYLNAPTQVRVTYFSSN
jgi:hypothetical protein